MDVIYQLYQDVTLIQRVNLGFGLIGIVVYIGPAEKVKSRVAAHNEKEIKASMKEGETIFYPYAPVIPKDLDIIENALAFAEEPKYNEKLKDNYNYDAAIFQIEGRHGLLQYTRFQIS